jgi:hypothetical protein
MEIRVAAVLDETTATALATRAGGRVLCGAQQACSEVEGERRLADPWRTGDDDGVRRRPGDHRLDGGDRRRVAAGQQPRHRACRGGLRLSPQTVPVSAFLRVVRRFGAAVSPVSEVATPLVGSSAVATDLVRVVRRFGAAAVPLSVVLAATAASSPAFLRVVRRFGAAASAASTAGEGDASASDDAAGLRRVGVRRFGGASTAGSVELTGEIASALGSRAPVSLPDDRDSPRPAGLGAALPDCAS